MIATGNGRGYRLDRDAPLYVAGHRGLVGSALWRLLRAEGFTRLLGRASTELDLRDRNAVFEFFDATRPDCVVLAAARVGGILANSTRPVEFLSDNLRIQLNVFDAALRFGTGRVLFCGSSCIYPRLAAQPITEDSLLTGPLEPTNDAYAIAKIAGVVQVQAVRRQYGTRWISVMPTNLYGPGDTFDPDDSHVLPGLLHRMHVAARAGAPEFVVWGTGTPRREFMHVDDAARACLLALERYDQPAPLNIGVGSDISIRELAELIAGVVGYPGRLVFDPGRPDGTPRKLLDVSRLASLGFHPAVSLLDGLRSTYRWYLAQAGEPGPGAVEASPVLSGRHGSVR
ncbi:MAG TPA: GDP-L-fucose synthase [Mycobacteriales bacterium]|nr:GDP-L-fucose synthase [Mycobacteriales bacterium]